MSDAAPQHILVVEDDPTISEVVARYLEREGYRPEIALDGEEALARASARYPDLVVRLIGSGILPGLGPNGIAVSDLSNVPFRQVRKAVVAQSVGLADTATMSLSPSPRRRLAISPGELAS